MFNFLVTTDRDRREAAALERRRARDEERKKRLFNPRVRLIGIDAVALKQQVDEKRKRDEDDKNVDKIFLDQLRKADEMALIMERKEKEERTKIQQEINNFRKAYQRPEDRREFDINDPEFKKKQVPCRTDDSKLGLSAAQKFEGEDFASDNRKKVQNEEIKSWLEQQMRERAFNEQQKRAADDEYQTAVIARDRRAVELDKLEKECRKRIQEEAVKFNKAKADEKLCAKLEAERKNTEDNWADICNFLNSDLMTESPDVAVSNIPGKKVANAYKGLTPAEQIALRKEQLQQIGEMKQRKELDLRRSREMDAYFDGTQQTIYLLDQEMLLKDKERKKKLAEENMRLAEEQKSRKRFLDKMVYSNIPSDEFYDQFNRTAR